MRSIFLSAFFAVLLPVAHGADVEIKLSDQEASQIGRKVWRNECAGTISGLTSWNAGENFASLGIGHFIWYPKGVDGPFDESFPKLVKFFQARGVATPGWLTPETRCPWNSRQEFVRDAASPRMVELRNLLAGTVPLQTEFLVHRLEGALPKMQEAAAPSARAKVGEQFYRVLRAGPAGAFALIDYVNFKGEGTLATERYKGEGWGLLQVLENMSSTSSPIRDFAASAKEMLARRVRNSPPARGEERWLPGWTSRVEAYAE